MLCRRLKPTLTKWSAETVKILFGQAVHDQWADKCSRLNLELAALVGIALSVCTRTLA